jgi:hypothetical protein
LQWALRGSVPLAAAAAAVAVCSAPQTPPEPGSRDREQMAIEYLRGRLPVWQQRLKLEDWNVSIVMAPPIDLRQGTLGNIRWDAYKKKAVIRVQSASDYHTPYREMVKDMEFTLVHELLHLELSSLPRSEASRSDEEHAVNRIADALLGLDGKR